MLCVGKYNQLPTLILDIYVCVDTLPSHDKNLQHVWVITYLMYLHLGGGELSHQHQV